MAAPEVAPTVRAGILADAVASLAKTLSRLEHKVTVALPRYALLDEAGLMLARRLKPLRFTVGDQPFEALLYDARLGSGVELLFIDIEGVFDGSSIYSGDVSDGRRFGLFCRALKEYIAQRKQVGTPFDVVHAHGWTTALLPFLLSKEPAEERPRTVLTVYDAAEQGRFPKETIDAIGLDWDDFNPEGLEFYGDLNMLKAGVVRADVVTTVSQRYAEEIQQAGAGQGLEGAFQARADDLSGITHGIEYARWSPATDPHLASRYDSEAVANKGRCKAALLHELDMPIEPSRPLLAYLGPVDLVHGGDLVLGALGEILRAGARVLLAGDGDPEIIAALQDLAATSPGDAVFLGALGEAMRHRVIAAADAVLVPSRREPCGLVQQYGQRYGAVPIVHAVGGLRDTVIDCDAQLETGTGFLFTEPSSEALLGAVQRALAAMRLPQWGALRRRVMRLDRSWERPARRFARLYRGA